MMEDSGCNVSRALSLRLLLAPHPPIALELSLNPYFPKGHFPIGDTVAWPGRMEQVALPKQALSRW
jgi:hypothetical protein